MNTEADQIKFMKEILKEELTLDKKLFWFDIILCAIFTWPFLIYAGLYKNLLTFFVGSFFLYKGTILIHEVSHLSKKIKGYRLFYNIFFGWPNGYPAYIYDTHLFHHGKKTYGTKRDPEYKYIEQITVTDLFRPLISAFILPLFQATRFGIVPLITPLLPRRVKLWLFQKLSTLVFSLEYVRPVRDEKQSLKMMIGNDLMCSAFKIVFFSLVTLGYLPLTFILVWYGSMVVASLLNMYRALFNHKYGNKSLESMSWEEHLRDTITIEPGLLTNIICVNGLNYHGIHHLFPELPYTNFARAHKKLMERLPDDHVYKETVYSSFSEVVSDQLFNAPLKNKLLQLN